MLSVDLSLTKFNLGITANEVMFDFVSCYTWRHIVTFPPLQALCFAGDRHKFSKFYIFFQGPTTSQRSFTPHQKRFTHMPHNAGTDFEQDSTGSLRSGPVQNL